MPGSAGGLLRRADRQWFVNRSIRVVGAAARCDYSLLTQRIDRSGQHERDQHLSRIEEPPVHGSGFERICNTAGHNQ
jgi:hypothetical protein